MTEKAKPLTPDIAGDDYAKHVTAVFKEKLPFMRNFNVAVPLKGQQIEVAGKDKTK